VLQLFNHKDIQPQHDFFAAQKNGHQQGLDILQACNSAHLIIYRHIRATAPKLPTYDQKPRPLGDSRFSHHQGSQHSAGLATADSTPERINAPIQRRWTKSFSCLSRMRQFCHRSNLHTLLCVPTK
jgi:hypothetical protein